MIIVYKLCQNRHFDIAYKLSLTLAREINLVRVPARGGPPEVETRYIERRLYVPSIWNPVWFFQRKFISSHSKICKKYN